MSQDEEEDRPGVSGVRGVISELTRVVWPSRDELFRMTAIVVAFLLVITVFIWITDVGLDWFFKTFIYKSA